MRRSRLVGGLLAAAFTVVAAFEGVRYVAYPDPGTGGAPWTICYGSTEGVRPGDRRTPAECRALLERELREFAGRMEACLRDPAALPDKVYVAFLSFAYNVGTGAFCGSTLRRLADAGRLEDACRQLPRWNRAAGRVLPGLTRRRAEEMAMCLEGVREGR